MSLIIENNGIKAIELNGNGNGISNEIVSSHWQVATGQEIILKIKKWIRTIRNKITNCINFGGTKITQEHQMILTYVAVFYVYIVIYIENKTKNNTAKKPS